MIILPPSSATNVILAAAAVQSATTAAAAATIAARRVPYGRLRRCTSPIGDDWQDMFSAPRDGTTVELCCTYGVAPWYGLFRWTDEQTIDEQVNYFDDAGVHQVEPIGKRTYKLDRPTWIGVSGQAGSVSDEAHLQWRPYHGVVDGYVDPTGGAQDGNDYWLRAAGMPLAASPATTKNSADDVLFISMAVAFLAFAALGIYVLVTMP